MPPNALRPLCLMALIGLLVACAAAAPPAPIAAWQPAPTQFTGGGSTPVVALVPQAQVTVAPAAQPVPKPQKSETPAIVTPISGVILGADGVSAGMASRLETTKCGVGLCTVHCSHKTDEHLVQRALSGGCNVTGAATMTGNYPLAAAANDPVPNTATGWACNTQAGAGAQDVTVTAYALCANVF